MKSVSLDDWRNYFNEANSDIFEVINKAIMVAASDYPKEFKSRRAQIAELLFTCKMTRCNGCDTVELAVPVEQEKDNNSEFDRGEECKFEDGYSNDNKANSSRNDQGEMNEDQTFRISYGEAEALSDEIEEENQIIEEVQRIKEVLTNSQEVVYPR